MIATAQKMKLCISDFFSKCEKSFLQIWLHLLKKSLMENFIFYAVSMFTCLSSLHIFIWIIWTIIYQSEEARSRPSQASKITLLREELTSLN